MWQPIRVETNFLLHAIELILLLTISYTRLHEKELISCKSNPFLSIFQTLQMMFSLAYFVPVLSCYFSIIYFLQSMNEITNLFFSHFFISAQDTDNPYNPEMIPFRGVLLLHQKLLRTMEMFADIMAAPLFAAFTFGVAYLALAFFEIVMVIW